VEEIFGFAHEVVQEFFAAKEMVRLVNDNLAVPRFADFLVDGYSKQMLNLMVVGWPEEYALFLDLAAPPQINFDEAVSETITKTSFAPSKLLSIGSKILNTIPLEALCKQLLQSAICLGIQFESDANLQAQDVKIIAKDLVDNNSLQLLNLSNNNIGSLGASNLVDGIIYNTSLKDLRLSGCALGTDGVISLCRGFQHNKVLKHLDLSSNEITVDGAATLALILTSDDNHLVSLNLSRNQIGSHGSSVISEALKSNTNLQSLWLSYNRIFDTGVDEVANALRVNATLKHLYFDHNYITRNGAAAIGASLFSNSGLEVLSLAHNELRDVGISALALPLADNTTLKELNLSNTRIGPQGASSLSQMLVRNKALQKLGLQTNLVGIEGACIIAKGLQNNTCLKSLSLCRNGICDSGAFALAEVLTQKAGDFLLVNKTLESLDVEFNAISYVGKKTLIDAKNTNKVWKELKIENYKTSPVDHSYESVNLVYSSRANYSINLCSIKSNII